MTPNYDIIYNDTENGIKFIANRVFQERIYYDISDVVSFEIDDTDLMVMSMSDGEKIRVMYGKEWVSDGYQENFDEGQYAYEICKQLEENGIPKTVNNIEKIQKNIDYYQKFSTDNLWTVYLPYMIEQS